MQKIGNTVYIINFFKFPQKSCLASWKKALPYIFYGIFFKHSDSNILISNSMISCAI